MKILIVSDTHRFNDNYIKALKREAPIDMLVHCGDIEGSEYFISENAHCECHMVAGNNDFFSQINREDEFYIGDYQVFLTHGHTYNVSMGNEILIEEAKSRGADIVMYGHTHKPVIDTRHEIIAINPGSLTYPRQEGRQPSYIVMTLDDEGEADFQIKYI